MMEIQEIPQDNSITYGGHRKVIYATQNGRYAAGKSTGRETEAYATVQAVEDLMRLTENAAEAVKSGKYSVLYYWMYRQRYDPASLAQAAGMARWRVKRHFRPEVFSRLPEKILLRYAALFGVSPQAFNNPFFHESSNV